MPSSITVQEIAGRLTSVRNTDGGWPYAAGKASRLEPSSWAVLALGAAGGADVLRTWPDEDGLLAERRGGRPNIGFHGLGLLALLARGAEHTRGNAALVRAVERVKGVALPDRGVNRQNNALQAWPWMAETFSWAEPTAYCLLALKKARAAGLAVDAARVADGEALLIDRCAADGGWNYGNANMLGQELPAYVPTTALGLLALGDRRADDPVRRSLDRLERDATSERSSLALSLAVVALGIFDRPTARIRTTLVEQLATTVALGSLHALAMALYALENDDDYAAFRL